ncbi:LuxR C-terminal-related transcriptional regulator [Nocardia sp. NPDC004168]|uniref:helix-turn-helix transcriptional regulator n=1 Tax=Nocardia sp. NPDC004168 TaxID=3154452 RepID=UPI0033AC528D
MAMQVNRGGCPPAAGSSLIGREAEFDAVGRLLVEPGRLITLIGPGGIGKSRLAAELARKFCKATHYPVFWARLERIDAGADLVAVAEQVALSVGAADLPSVDPTEASIDMLSNVGDRVLLVLDRCEHVRPDAAVLVDELLRRVAGLTVLATSREPLRWIDEQLIAVPPLTLAEAVALFKQHAELACPSATTEEQADSIEQVCVRLHCNPLFIRHASSRLRREPLAAVLDGLSGDAADRRLHWRSRTRFGQDTSHKSVRDALMWSYELCTDKERRLLERLSAFASGYEPEFRESGEPASEGAALDAIEAICSDDTVQSNSSFGLHRYEIKALLDNLVGQSLVAVHFSDGTVRYTLTESVRLFAQERLGARDSGEIARLSQSHLRYYHARVLEAYACSFGPGEHVWAEWTRGAWQNIHKAADTARANPVTASLGLEILTTHAAYRLPFLLGKVREILRWALQALAAMSANESVEARVSAMAYTAWLMVWQGENEAAERMLDDCMAVYGWDVETRSSWRMDPEADVGRPVVVEMAWGTALLLAHGDPASITVLGRARDKFGIAGDKGSEATAEFLEAIAAGLYGGSAQAFAIGRRHFDRATASGGPVAASWAEVAWAVVQAKHGDPQEALAVGQRALNALQARGDEWGAVWAVHVRIWCLAKLLGEPRAESADPAELASEIAILAGGCERLHLRLGLGETAYRHVPVENAIAVNTARRVLGGDRFAATYEAGTAMRPERGEVQRFALGTFVPRRGPGAESSTRWSALTAAECEVALLAAAGWTNVAIAARRSGSPKTVGAQMIAIFQKLMITTRADIIGHVPGHLLDRVRKEDWR